MHRACTQEMLNPNLNVVWEDGVGLQAAQAARGVSRPSARPRKHTLNPNP